MITLIPVGGLANRMRTIASTLTLARNCDSPLRIVWFKDRGLNCRFDQLFRQPVTFPNVEVIEAGHMDIIRYDRPRRRNIRIPRLIQKLLFDSCIYEDEVIQKRDNGFDFESWVKSRKNVYIASYICFVPYSHRLLREFFLPVASIQNKVDGIVRHFDAHTIGVHIRRTDNIHSIHLSPLSLFIERIQQEIQTDGQTKFYLASDSPEDKNTLAERFGDRIYTHHFSAERNRPEGIQDALAELLVLSRTHQIIGSCWSSFSEIAAQLTDIPCIILKKN